MPATSRAVAFDEVFAWEQFPFLFGLIAVVCLLIYVVGHIARLIMQRREREEQTRAFYADLGKALHTNAQIFIKARDGNWNVQEVRGHFQNVSRDRVCVVTPGQAPISPMWEGREVNVFFYVRREGRYDFQSFDAVVRVVRQSEFGPLAELKPLTLFLPTQRRAFVRFSPPSHCVQAFDVRCAKAEAGKTLGEEYQAHQVAWQRLPRAESCVLKDISGGGARLHVVPDFPLYAELRPGDLVLLYIKLAGVKRIGPIEMITAGTCVNVRAVSGHDGSDPYKTLGITFSVYGEYSTENGKMVWKTVNPQRGLPGLANWVIQMQFVCSRQTSQKTNAAGITAGAHQEAGAAQRAARE